MKKKIIFKGFDDFPKVLSHGELIPDPDKKDNFVIVAIDGNEGGAAVELYPYEQSEAMEVEVGSEITFRTLGYESKMTVTDETPDVIQFKYGEHNGRRGVKVCAVANGKDLDLPNTPVKANKGAIVKEIIAAIIAGLICLVVKIILSKLGE